MSSTTNKVKGIITEIKPIKKISEKFSVSEICVKTDGDYPQEVKFSVFNKNIDKLTKGLKVGDVVDIGFNLKGRRHENEVYNTLEAWSIFKFGAPSGKGQSVSKPDYTAEAKPSTKSAKITEDSDLPF